MKKLLVPLILICALLVPVGMLGGISCLWNLETLYVQDIYGNRSALLPYTVTGNLGDDVHNLSFTSILTHIKGKNVPKQTQDVCLLHTRIKEKSYSYDNRVPSNIICCSNSAKDVHTTLSAQSTVLRNRNVTGFYLCIIRLHH